MIVKGKAFHCCPQINIIEISTIVRFRLGLQGEEYTWTRGLSKCNYVSLVKTIPLNVPGF